jgi:integrase
MARKGGKDRGLFEYPPGVWWIRYADGNGRERTEKIGPKGLARKRYMQRKVEISEGRYAPKTRAKVVMFEELIEDYKKASARRGTAIMRTDAGYRRALEAFGGRRAESITSREVEEWRDSLAETLAPASVAHHLTMLRAIFNRAVRDGKLTVSPTRGVEFPKENNERIRYLTEDEERSLTQSVDDWLRPLIVFGIHTGLRRGEILSLLWSDIDLGSGSLHVREAKSGQGRRLPLNETAMSVLSEFQQHAGYVFGPDTNAKRMRLNRAFRRAAKAASIDNLHFHDLRHTFASRLVMRGVDLYRVQKLLGHLTARMTQRYAHMSPDYLRQAVGMLVKGPDLGPG